MKLAKIIVFVMFIVTGVTSLYGMNDIPERKTLGNKLMKENLSPEDTLNILKANEEYEWIILFEYQKDLDVLQGINWTMLRKAIDQNYLPLINFLVEKNANLSQRLAEMLLEEFVCYARLRRCTVTSKEERDHKRFIQFLLRKGFDLNWINGRLGWAIRKECPIVVEILIENGADINLPGHKDSSPLNLAIYNIQGSYNNNERIIRNLLDAGADPKRQDKRGNIPEKLMKHQSYIVKQTDWGQYILGIGPLPKPLPKSYANGNPDGNNPNNPSLFNVIKQHKGFACVGAVIGVGAIVWVCKKLYAKYYDDKNKQEEDDNEQFELVAD